VAAHLVSTSDQLSDTVGGEEPRSPDAAGDDEKGTLPAMALEPIGDLKRRRAAVIESEGSWRVRAD
jgi:hypothetical protein